MKHEELKEHLNIFVFKVGRIPIKKSPMGEKNVVEGSGIAAAV